MHLPLSPTTPYAPYDMSRAHALSHLYPYATLLCPPGHSRVPLLESYVKALSGFSTKNGKPVAHFGDKFYDEGEDGIGERACPAYRELVEAFASMRSHVLPSFERLK